MLSESRQIVEAGPGQTGSRAAAIIAATLVMFAGAAVVGFLARGASDPAARTPAFEMAVAGGSISRTPAAIAGDSSATANPDAVAAEPLPQQSPAAAPAVPAPGEEGPSGPGARVAEIDPVGPSPRLNPRRSGPNAGEGAEEAVVASGEPRLKPAPGATAGATRTASRGGGLLVLGQTMLAQEDRRAPFYFEDEVAGPVASQPPPAVRLAGDIDEAPRTASVRLTKGENFVDALRRAGVRPEDRNAAAAAFGRLYDLRRLRPGQEMRLTTAAPAQTLFQIVAEGHEPESYLLALDFKVDATNRIALNRAPDGVYAGKKVAVALSTRLASVSGRINGSLYNSAKRIGAPDKVVADLAAIFAYDVDFQREVFGGDEFEAVFEAHFDENGRLVEAGDILYGRMKWKGRQKEKGYYRFASADGGARADYFDWSGESAKRLLMKTPIDGARLSSGFGARRHPISGYNKQHKGVDFAASRGTPIKAAGDGVVERADRYGGYGNYVRIRHGKGYKTAYGHMSGFAKGMRAGKRVEQGDIIGYVGSTGASTGPHLHYEVLQDGKHVNPQKLKVATGVSLTGPDLKKFKEARDALDAERRASATDRLADDGAAKQL